MKYTLKGGGQVWIILFCLEQQFAKQYLQSLQKNNNLEWLTNERLSQFENI